MESIHEKDDTRSWSDQVPVPTAGRNDDGGAKSLRPTDYAVLLKRVVMAYDTSDDMEFLAGMHAARLALGFRLQPRANDDDVAVLIANGYDEYGRPR